VEASSFTLTAKKFFITHRVLIKRPLQIPTPLPLAGETNGKGLMAESTKSGYGEQIAET
jgi:hypothetical protein